MAWDSYGLDTNTYTLDTYSLDSCRWDTYGLDTLDTYGLDSCGWDIYGLDTYVHLWPGHLRHGCIVSWEHLVRTLRRAARHYTHNVFCCNVLCSTEWQI